MPSGLDVCRGRGRETGAEDTEEALPEMANWCSYPSGRASLPAGSGRPASLVGGTKTAVPGAMVAIRLDQICVK